VSSTRMTVFWAEMATFGLAVTRNAQRNFDYMLIHITGRNHIGIIHFQNGELNLLSADFINELNCALTEMDLDDAVRVIVLASDKKAFCAGANLKELLRVSEAKKTSKSQNSYDPIEDWQRLSFVEKPVIACVNGACLGGGLEMALMCDFIVASEQATFGFPEIKLGLLPGGGGTQRILERISMGNARELIMFGDSITAETAYEWGLVNAVFDPDECFDGALNLASKLASKSLDSLKAIKKLLAMANAARIKQGLIIERATFYERLESPEAAEKINAFFDRKK
jgi:enoyl-CoA hydratase